MNVHPTDMCRGNTKRTDANAVSFDVFDTFLVRACTDFEGVFERAFQLSPAAAMFPDASVAYVEHRRQAEGRARREAMQRCGSPEVGIADIYSVFPFRLYRLKREMLPQLVAAEFAAELDLCRANPDVLAKYREMRAAGVRTGFISDTYWSVEQLRTLLLRACPDLVWDFLYSSCDSGTNKSNGLFAVYLSEQRVAAHCAVHLGDNFKADIDGARRHGMTALHLPQASAGLTSIFNREVEAARLLCTAGASALDGGVRTLRRLVVPLMPLRSGGFALGTGVVGPVLHAFDAFVADRIAAIDGGSGDARVAFLARDGFLSHRIWSETRPIQASYLEINRRVAMIASADTLEPLIELISKLPEINADAFKAIAKCLPAPLAAFFARCPQGIATGRDLAVALPELLVTSDIAAIAAELRAELMQYLRLQIPGLDDGRDLVLVDLGYSGSIQKALRRIFDIEGIKVRLHGLYLMTLDDGFADCDDNDSYEGLISDLVVTPRAKRLLLRNIVVLEQICCSNAGSVRGYRDGRVQHEAHLLPDDQLALVREIQDGAAAYAKAVNELAPIIGMSPHADFDRAANTAAAILSRLLLLPTDNDLQLIGAFKHDVNLGTTHVTPLIDTRSMDAVQITRSLPDACVARYPAMWLAGSFAAMSPAQGFLYLLSGCNSLPGDLFGDVGCGELGVTLIDRRGKTSAVTVATYRNAFGEIRIRIPVSRGMAIRAMVLPVARLAVEAIVSGPFLQSATTVSEALGDDRIVLLEPSCVRLTAMTRSGRHYRSEGDAGALTIDLPESQAAVSVLSIGIAPIDGARILATD
jgi:FMN phosphatase YigB (HAD superfamily)